MNTYNNAHRIDYANWPRREIFEFFSRVSDPFYMVSFTVDVTELRAYCRRYQLSFYLSMVYFCTKAINSVENFRYKLINGEVYLLEKRDPSFTDMRRGEDLFHITTVGMREDPEDFVRAARAMSERQTGFIESETETEDLIYFTSLPGLRMTSMTNERDRLASGASSSNIPSISWGRYEQNGDRIELNVSIEVNHRFIDGIHITRFAEALERMIGEL